jgi:hypothetical protein
MKSILIVLPPALSPAEAERAQFGIVATVTVTVLLTVTGCVIRHRRMMTERNRFYPAFSVDKWHPP